jgi:hypothetical protein
MPIRDENPRSSSLASIATPDGYVSGTRLLLSDCRVALLLLDEARCRVMERVLGVPRDKSFVVTIIALGTLAEAVHSKVTQVLNAPGGPSVGDTVVGVAMLKESVHWIAGPDSRNSTLFGTLVAIAVLGASARPVVGASLRGVKAGSRRARAGFDRRYVHPVFSSSRNTPRAPIGGADASS